MKILHLIDPMVLKEETTATTPTATIDSSKRDSSQARSVIDPPPLILSTLSERRQMNLNLKVSVPPGHFQIPPLLRACDERQLKTNSNSVCASAEQSQESRCVMDYETLQCVVVYSSYVLQLSVYFMCRLTETKQERRESHINIGVSFICWPILLIDLFYSILLFHDFSVSCSFQVASLDRGPATSAVIRDNGNSLFQPRSLQL